MSPSRVLRPCLGYPSGTRCPNLTAKTRCEGCERRYQQDRNASRPGHRAAHARARRALQPIVDAGLAVCPRCGNQVVPGTPWDADRYQGTWRAAHAHCNRAAH